MKYHQQPHGSWSRGFTLIEMLVVITAVTFIAGLLITVLGTLSASERLARRDRANAAAMEDAGSQLRRAAHAAVGVEPPADFASDEPLDHIRFDLGSGAWMQFRRDGPALEITGQRRDATGQLVARRQRIRLEGRGEPRLALNRREGRLVAVLAWAWPEVVKAARAPGRAVRPPWAVEAIVGRDRDQGGGVSVSWPPDPGRGSGEDQP